MVATYPTGCHPSAIFLQSYLSKEKFLVSGHWGCVWPKEKFCDREERSSHFYADHFCYLVQDFFFFTKKTEKWTNFFLMKRISITYGRNWSVELLSPAKTEICTVKILSCTQASLEWVGEGHQSANGEAARYKHQCERGRNLSFVFKN